MRKRSRFLRFAAHDKTVSSFGRNDDCFGLGKKNRAPGHFGLVNSKKARADKRGVLASWAEGDFQVVDRLAVADAFELAVELGGGVVRVAVFFFVVGFGLALFCGVVEVGLGQGLEREEDEAEGGGGVSDCGAIRLRREEDAGRGWTLGGGSVQQRGQYVAGKGQGERLAR